MNTLAQIVQNQLKAYNAQDLEAFLECYSDDIECIELPQTIRFRGKEAMRQRYGSLFSSNPNQNCEVVSRSCSANFIIDYEIISGRSDGMTRSGMVVYQLSDHLISRFWAVGWREL